MRIRVRLNEGVCPETQVDKFSLDYNARLEFVEAGYYVPIGQIAMCSDCDSQILLHTADSLEYGFLRWYGFLRCACSEWQCSGMMGTTGVQHSLERRRWLSKDEIIQHNLETLPAPLRKLIGV